MTSGRRFRIVWLAGLALLAVAHAAHASEQWEMAAHVDCVAHTDADSDKADSGSCHDHGCSAHDHAPALAGGKFLLPFTETVAVFSPVCLAAPAPRASSIDHPPQLS